MADVNPEIIEFDIEMAPIPNQDKKPNDITMNWKLLSGFETNKTFYTDGNGLQMSQKKIVKLGDERNTIANNFFPIASAIAVRDARNTSNVQVTIMNDRPQAGSADLSEGNVIELM
jgi:hypothetical protein